MLLINAKVINNLCKDLPMWHSKYYWHMSWASLSDDSDTILSTTPDDKSIIQIKLYTNELLLGFSKLKQTNSYWTEFPTT